MWINIFWFKFIITAIFLANQTSIFLNVNELRAFWSTNANSFCRRLYDFPWAWTSALISIFVLIWATILFTLIATRWSKLISTSINAVTSRWNILTTLFIASFCKIIHITIWASNLAFFGSKLCILTIFTTIWNTMIIFLIK